jgi:hypothetical protein
MSKNAMAGAVTLCGVGLCMIGGAMLMQNGAQAHANSVVSALPAAAAVASTATAQAGGEPTVVWYQAENIYEYNSYSRTLLFRAWSDGTVEARVVEHYPSGPCEDDIFAQCPQWMVISSPSAGYRAAADINADEKVDGADLTMILGNWGDAPRVPFPPSDCPLNLVNP